MNPAAMALIGNPTSVTVTAHGFNLIVIAEGTVRLEITPGGSGRFRLKGLDIGPLVNPGDYRLSTGHYVNLRGVVFRGALISELSLVLRSPGRDRYSRAKQNRGG